MKFKLIIPTLIFLFCFTFTNNAFAQKRKKNHAKRHVKHHIKKHRKGHVRHLKARKVAHHKYSHLPKRGKIIKWTHATVFHRAIHKGINYRLHKGVWHRPKGSKFIVIKAPFGIRVKTLPLAHKKIIIGSKHYFYYYGTYYAKTDNSEDEYEVINPPIGAEVDALPDNYKIVKTNGLEYYKFDDTYYEPVINDQDEEYYIVIDNPTLD